MKISCYNCGQKLDLSELPPFTKIACPVCQVRIIVPRPFGNLLLEEDIGTGRMAKVYRAMDITLDREVAVKMLNPDLENSELPQLFINEARSASAINHPNVIPIYSCGEMENQTYITMQYMEGGSLLKKAQSRERPLDKDACKWIIETAKGLDSASIHGVVHHNIKPSNIFLDLDGNVKVGDFGISQILDDNRPLFENNQVSDRVTLDMSHYLSPEKISTGRQDIAGDIYSLGATLYHVVCGVPPFSSQSIEENVKARFEGPPKPPKELRAEVDAELNDLIVRMLSIYPSDRPRSYTALGSELSAIRKRLRMQHPEHPTNVGMDQTVSVEPVPTTAAAATGNQPRTNKVITISSTGKSRKTLQDEDKFQSTTTQFLMRVIPLIIIAVTILLVVAHKKNWPIYNRTLRPVFESIFGDGGEDTDDISDDTIE